MSEEIKPTKSRDDEPTIPIDDKDIEILREESAVTEVVEGLLPNEIRMDLVSIQDYVSAGLEKFMRKNHETIFSGTWFQRNFSLSPERTISDYVKAEMPHKSRADFSVDETLLAGEVAKEVYATLMKPRDADDRAALDDLATGVGGNLSSIVDDNVRLYFGTMIGDPARRTKRFDKLVAELGKGSVQNRSEAEEQDAGDRPKDSFDDRMSLAVAPALTGALYSFMEAYRESIFDDQGNEIVTGPERFIGDYVKESLDVIKGFSFTGKETERIVGVAGDIYKRRLMPRDDDDKDALKDLSEGVGGDLSATVEMNVSHYLWNDKGRGFVTSAYRSLIDEMGGQSPPTRWKRYAMAGLGAVAIGIAGGIVVSNVDGCEGCDEEGIGTTYGDVVPFIEDDDDNVDAARASFSSDAGAAEVDAEPDADGDSSAAGMEPWQSSGPLTYDDGLLPKLPGGAVPDGLVVQFYYDSAGFSDPLQVEALEDRLIEVLEEAEQRNEEEGAEVPVHGVVINATCTSSAEGPLDRSLEQEPTVNPDPYNIELSGERGGVVVARVADLADQFDYGAMESGAWGVGEIDAFGEGTGGPDDDGYGPGSDNPNRACVVTFDVRDDSPDVKSAVAAIDRDDIVVCRPVVEIDGVVECDDGSVMDNDLMGEDYSMAGSEDEVAGGAVIETENIDIRADVPGERDDILEFSSPETPSGSDEAVDALEEGRVGVTGAAAELDGDAGFDFKDAVSKVLQEHPVKVRRTVGTDSLFGQVKALQSRVYSASEELEDFYDAYADNAGEMSRLQEELDDYSLPPGSKSSPRMSSPMDGFGKSAERFVGVYESLREEYDSLESEVNSRGSDAAKMMMDDIRFIISSDRQLLQGYGAGRDDDSSAVTEGDDPVPFSMLTTRKGHNYAEVLRQYASPEGGTVAGLRSDCGLDEVLREYESRQGENLSGLRSAAKSAVREDLAGLARELRGQGRTYAEIGEKLGVHRTTASRYVNRG